MDYLERLRGMSEDERANEIEAKLSDNYHGIVELDEFERAANRTSAANWAVEEHEVTDIDFGDDECVVRFTFAASGDPPEDGFFDGDRIDGEAKMVIDPTGHVTFRLLAAEVSDGADWEGEEF